MMSKGTLKVCWKISSSRRPLRSTLMRAAAVTQKLQRRTPEGRGAGSVFEKDYWTLSKP
jgi:hypothetical protein